MTIKNDVIAAYGKLDPRDDALWNKDGTPKLEAIRNAAADQKITRDEMADSIGDLRRPEVKAEPEQAAPPPPAPQEQPPAQASPPAPAAEDRPDTVNTTKPEVPGVEDSSTPDKAKLVAEAQANIAEIDAEIAKVAPVLNDSASELKRLQGLRDREVNIVEANTVLLSHAESVKRVQAQTLANLQANKSRMNLVSTTLAASGLKVAASPLDAALSGRKRTPEMAANAAAYHRNRQGERLAERLGQS